MSLLIGLTGGIACGKSAVSKRLAQRGALIIDADQISRDVLAPASLGLKAIVTRWGDELLQEDGSLNRTKLSALVFQDPEARHELEQITHPLIAQMSAEQIAAALVQNPPLVVYDAALLIEAGRAEAFRPLVVVTTTPEIQRLRLMARDSLSAAQAEARIQAQLPLQSKEALADYIVYNDGDWASLDAQVDQLWEQLFSNE